tara:strand:- start:335 stop:556 length:222 start_codon:yes stop_codon:yes gene_type:complete
MVYSVWSERLTSQVKAKETMKKILLIALGVFFLLPPLAVSTATLVIVSACTALDVTWELCPSTEQLTEKGDIQ